MVRVKICGLTSVEDARASSEFGASMLGFNFYEKSPRYISPLEARRLIDHLPKGIEKVGVFVNMEGQQVGELADLLDLDAVQLHGDESAEFISALRRYTGVKVIKAFRVSPEFQIELTKEFAADSVLLDAYSRGQYGGTGEQFEWSIAAEASASAPELILAGGLTPENVAKAIRTVHPYAVDVASGVESAPGKKDLAKLEAFIRNAKQA